MHGSKLGKARSSPSQAMVPERHDKIDRVGRWARPRGGDEEGSFGLGEVPLTSASRYGRM